MDQITVRPARLEDVDAIAQLWQALVEFHCSLDSNLPLPTSQGAIRYARRLMDHLDDPMAKVLVAVLDGEVIGYVLGVVVDLAPELFAQEPSGFLADIYVDADHRRSGVGTALVKGLMDWFRQRNVRFFEWHAAAQNPDGIAFWRALGGRDVMVRMRADIFSANHNTESGDSHKDA